MIALLAAALLVVNFLHRNSYSFIRIESILLLVVVWLFFSCIGSICRAVRKQWLYSAILIIAIVDLSVGWDKVFAWTDWKIALFLGGVIVTLISYLLRAQIQKLVFVAVIFSLISGVTLNALQPTALYKSSEKSQAAQGASQNSVFVFILDEHIGFAGLPNKELLDDYVARGFAVHTNAYSNYNSTSDSIPSLLNAKVSDRNALLNGKKLKQNRLFEKWTKEGRELFIYQNTHLDFASTPGISPAKVFVYQESSAGYLNGSGLSLYEKFFVVSNNFIESQGSVLTRRLYRLFFRKKKEAGAFMTGAIATSRVLSEIRSDALRPGLKAPVYFAHFLMPHSHYVYDENGKIVSPFLWRTCYSDELDELGTLNSAEDRQEKYKLYASQIRYLHRQLFDFYDFLKKNGLYEKSTILLLSDHGSRISRVNPVARHRERLSAEDHQDAFSAFFAIKDSSGGRIVPAVRSASLILGEYFGILPDEEVARQSLVPAYLTGDGTTKTTAVAMAASEN